MFVALCTIESLNDGLTLLPESVHVDAIREDQEYGGTVPSSSPTIWTSRQLDAPEMPELLHPRMADVYREKVGRLCLALEREESRKGAPDAIRAHVEAIALESDADQLKITVKGDLVGMLSTARPPSRAADSGRASASLAGAYGGGGDSKRSPDTGDLLLQIILVAGTRNQWYLQRWSGAA